MNPSELNKKNKQISNLSEELKIYKSELASERERTEKLKKNLESKVEQLTSQNKELKEKNSFLQKKLDLRDIEATELAEQVKLFKLMDRENTNLVKNYIGSPRGKKDEVKMIGS